MHGPRPVGTFIVHPGHRRSGGFQLADPCVESFSFDEVEQLVDPASSKDLGLARSCFDKSGNLATMGFQMNLDRMLEPDPVGIVSTWSTSLQEIPGVDRTYPGLGRSSGASLIRPDVGNHPEVIALKNLGQFLRSKFRAYSLFGHHVPRGVQGRLLDILDLLLDPVHGTLDRYNMLAHNWIEALAAHRVRFPEHFLGNEVQRSSDWRRRLH